MPTINVHKKKQKFILSNQTQLRAKSNNYVKKNIAENNDRRSIILNHLMIHNKNELIIT